MEQEVKYLIKYDYNLSNDDRLILLYLYQPIIGHRALSLYLLFSANGIKLEFNTKYEIDDFLTILQLSEQELEAAKDKLATIGLLKISRRSKERSIILKPQLPVSASAFFENAVLSDFLINKIGEDKFKRLKNKFLAAPSNPNPIANNLNVTLDFLYIDKYLLGKNANNKLYLPYREKIIQLANYYGILTKDIANYIYKSIEVQLNQRIFNYDKFTNLLSDAYQKIVLKKHLEGEQLNLVVTIDNTIAPSNMMEVKISEMTSIDPIEYLTLLRDNVKPTPLEIDLIRDLIIQYHLQPGIVNCLIEYVWFKNNCRIERKYCEKIANTFNQLQISNVESAMYHLRNAYNKTQKGRVKQAVIKESANVNYYKKVGREKGKLTVQDFEQLYQNSDNNKGDNKVDLKTLINELESL
ncbi:chromosome replication initiation and membrane attachment protein [Spiroplasma syrphidicola EA-1]|uniref:Chromosome replication initiation and membrane attachment protein n=1 Tax=Spiroplasma syrphidicola EA-1 TaxID=1276229 RepID=R4U300_9MOLU|nr:DnaD domain protein [Spiroplasma syrphidicola]AGM25757.1 chromosome replication initiation and membrane attachment protein [Spiroplasma syrphidicola EA-1]